MKWTPGMVAAIALLILLSIMTFRSCCPDERQRVDSDAGEEPETATKYSWPFEPQESVHEIGNQHGQFVLGSVHEGLDILPSGTTRDVCAVKAGVVTMLTENGFQSGLVIGENVDGGEGVVYWHLTPGSLQVGLFDPVEAGEKIAEMSTDFPEPDFQHLHFEFVQGEGDDGWDHHEPTESPITYLDPDTDTSPPTLVQGAHDSAVRFYRNDTADDPLDPEDLSGLVDVVVQVEDLQLAANTWLLVPYRIQLSIVRFETEQEVYASSLEFDGPLKEDDLEELAKILYMRGTTSNTIGNYEDREFFVIVTNVFNVDNPVLEDADTSGAWNTTTLNGEFEVRVSITDEAGSGVSETVLVKVDNSP